MPGTHVSEETPSSVWGHDVARRGTRVPATAQKRYPLKFDVDEARKVLRNEG